MAIRPHHILAATTIAGLLCLLLPCPSLAATATGKEQQVGNARHKRGTGSPKQPRAHSAKKRGGNTISPFVLLGQQLLDDSLARTIAGDIEASPFDLAHFGCLFTDKRLLWVWAQLGGDRIERGEVYWAQWVDSWQNVIEIQPLDLDAGTYDPFYGNFFSPLVPGPLRLSADDVSPSLTTSLLESGNPSRSSAVHADSGTGGRTESPFAYRYRMDDKSTVNAGVTWIQDIADTKGMALIGDDDTTDSVSGVNLTLGASYRDFTLTGGYLRAIDSEVGPADLAVTNGETDPIAWNSELAYSTELLHRETTLAVGYLKSSDALQLYLPEERYKTRASMVLRDTTTFTLEYYLDKEYSTDKGMGEDEGYGITTKIGFEF
jgi:hypothetical protein